LGVFDDFNRWVLWRIENKKDCNERELIWLRNEATMVKNGGDSGGARVLCGLQRRREKVEDDL